MGRKIKREYAEDELVSLPPSHVTGSDHRLLVETLKTVIDKDTGKPIRLGKFLDKLAENKVADIRAGKRIKI